VGMIALTFAFLPDEGTIGSEERDWLIVAESLGGRGV
jgi:hypothetical protein